MVCPIRPVLPLLLRSMPPRDPAHHFAGLRIERMIRASIRGGCTRIHPVHSSPPRDSGTTGSSRLKARTDGFVHAKKRRVPSRAHVHPVVLSPAFCSDSRSFKLIWHSNRCRCTRARECVAPALCAPARSGPMGATQGDTRRLRAALKASHMMVARAGRAARLAGM